VVAGLASGPWVDDDTEVHEAAAVAPNGGAQPLEQRSARRGRVECGRSSAATKEE
jgi:hypothetical protein